MAYLRNFRLQIKISTIYYKVLDRPHTNKIRSITSLESLKSLEITIISQNKVNSCSTLVTWT